MTSVHNAVADTLDFLGLDALLNESTIADPNAPECPRYWTVQLSCKDDVSTTHPLHRAVFSVRLRSGGAYEVRVLGRAQSAIGDMDRRIVNILEFMLAV
jgi:hypothetical protein